MSSHLETPSKSIKRVIFTPQKGKQEQFLSSSADICLYGGGAGGGKTAGIMGESMRHIYHPKFTCSIFRRTYTEIFGPGGMWSSAEEYYPPMGGSVLKTEKKWTFSRRAGTKLGSVSFHSMKDEKDKYSFQGSEITLICFDELTHFSSDQWNYMFSRNRSTCGIRPYIRATCNPQTEGFVRDLVDWWIDSDGFACEERSGVIRYMLRDNNDVQFYDTITDVPRTLRDFAKTFTFIPSKVYDNKILMEKDPGYISNLMALPLFERMQLLEGNWNVKKEAGMYFRSHWFEVVDSLPANPIYMQFCRYWDRAATTPKEGIDPDYTVGLKLGKYKDILYIVDVVRIRDTPLKVQQAIMNMASQDGECIIGLEQECGASGIAECEYLKSALYGFNVEVCKAERSKEWRAKPASAASEQGKIKILRGDWNKDLIKELQDFPFGQHDDQVDSLSGAFNILNKSVDYSVFNRLIASL